MKRGIVIGKFYPPHRGHKYLIDFATDLVDELTIIVCFKKTEKIAGNVRANWMRQIHLNAHVIVVDDIGKDDDSQAWAEYTLQFLGYKPDIVFTSEQYGYNYAKYLGCRHVLVDLNRTTVPVSATLVRANPVKYLEYLEPIVRLYFVRRICILGAESTGTTTLSKALASYYKTNWVPEFGRYYSERVQNLGKYEWRSTDFDFIANAQNELEDRLAMSANKVLICDTDSFATYLWHKRYMGFESESVKKLNVGREYDLYILTGDEIPFVQDGIRDGEHIRHDMHQMFIEELRRQNKPYVLVTGSKEERLAKAIELCDRVLAKQIFD
jgi:HTH-type transcriptional regulator, transcriptional repressor of NAD biosynthesis genes